jgi:hypothetical protein
MLDDMEKTISMAAFVKDPEGIVAAVENGDAMYRIKGRNAILVDRSSFERMEDWQVFAEFVMHYPDWRKELADVKRELAAGEGRELHEMLRELGLEGQAKSPSRGAAARPAATRPKSRGKNASRPRTRATPRKTDR